MRNALQLLGLMFAGASLSIGWAQTDAPAPASAEMRHFDFWPGKWVKIVNGHPDPKATSFTVKRSIHDAAFEEEWRQINDRGEIAVSRAFRAWDQIGGRWMLAWISQNALFQVWEGRKFGDRWYIVREFEVEGRKFLSRQAWWLSGPDRVTRLMERSFDGGANWELRSREEFGRVAE